MVTVPFFSHLDVFILAPLLFLPSSRAARASGSPDPELHGPLTTVWEANSKAKTEFQLHRYERTEILREVARGVHAPARAGMDVPPNRGGSEHQRANHCGVARGIGLAPSPTRQKAPDASRVSIKDMSGRRKTISNRGQAFSSFACPDTVPDALRQGRPTRMRKNKDDMSNERSSKPFQIKAQYAGGAQ
jgi:hypothetical protein